MKLVVKFKNMNKNRKKRIRRTVKQVIKFGKNAKRKHIKIGGRTGDIRHKRLKSMLFQVKMKNKINKRKLRSELSQKDNKYYLDMYIKFGDNNEN